VGRDWLPLEKDQSAAVVPVRYQDEVVAYLYLVVRQRHAFHASDVDFLIQVGEAVVPMLENIQLVANAAAEERRRIARDLHDNVVQSYLALQIGLTALHERLAAGAVDVRSGLEHLLEFASAGVTDIRGYVRGLRNGHGSVGDLLSAVEGFAATFAKAAGITVRVEAETEVRISGRLATEAFHMVAEGLSNVKRHTSARQVVVRLACREDNLILCIENDQPRKWAPFTPRSITERAAALGGHVRVENCEVEGTAVTVTVPL
jgi:signal transduction histidine kinase